MTPAPASPRTALPPAAPHTSDGRAREATSPAASIGRAAKAGSNGWAKSSEDWFKRLVGSEGEKRQLISGLDALVVSELSSFDKPILSGTLPPPW